MCLSIFLSVDRSIDMFIYLVFIYLFAGDASAKDIDTAMKLGAGKKRLLSIIPTVDAD